MYVEGLSCRRATLDIAAIILKGHADVFVLVAGDSDFVPAMKFARRENFINSINFIQTPMGPISNPYASGAGALPPELVGRDWLRHSARA